VNQEYSTFISSSFYEKSDFIEGFSEKIRDTHNWNKLAIRFKSWENSRHQIANPIPKIIHQIQRGPLSSWEEEPFLRCPAIAEPWDL